VGREATTTIKGVQIRCGGAAQTGMGAMAAGIAGVPAEKSRAGEAVDFRETREGYGSSNLSRSSREKPSIMPPVHVPDGEVMRQESCVVREGSYWYRDVKCVTCTSRPWNFPVYLHPKLARHDSRKKQPQTAQKSHTRPGANGQLRHTAPSPTALLLL
jgi:hypothetical protein